MNTSSLLGRADDLGLKLFHLGILEGFMSPCECGFDRLGHCVNLACSLCLAQPGAGMLQSRTTVKTGHCNSKPSYSLAKVKLTILEAMQMICVGAKPLAQWQLTWNWAHPLITCMLLMLLITASGLLVFICTQSHCQTWE